MCQQSRAKFDLVCDGFVGICLVFWTNFAKNFVNFDVRWSIKDRVIRSQSHLAAQDYSRPPRVKIEISAMDHLSLKVLIQAFLTSSLPRSLTQNYNQHCSCRCVSFAQH